MNTLIRIRGWVTESSVIHPQSKIDEPDKIHRLHIQPENPQTFLELEQAVSELKRQTQDVRKLTKYRHKDELIDGCEVILKSFYKPKLYEEFKDYQRDEQLLGKFAQTVGHLRIFKDKNVCLTVHIIEPAYHDNFDPLNNLPSK